MCPWDSVFDKEGPIYHCHWKETATFLSVEWGWYWSNVLSLAVTSSFSPPPGGRVTPFSSEIDEQLTSVGPHYPGNEANAWRRQCFPMARALTHSTLCWAVLWTGIILHFDLNLFVFLNHFLNQLFCFYPYLLIRDGTWGNWSLWVATAQELIIRCIELTRTGTLPGLTCSGSWTMRS